MANSKVFVSPGVYTSEVDLSFVASSVGVTTLGIVGETLKGPAFEPIFIKNYDEFQTIFGGTSPEKFVNTQIPKYEAAYIAKSYLQQSNQLFVSRILGLSGYDAGPSWSIKTIANVDPGTVGYNGTTNSPTQFLFSADTSSGTFSTYNYSFDEASVSGALGGLDINQSYRKTDGSTSTIAEDIKNWISDMVAYNESTGVINNLPIAYFWGSIPSSEYNTLSSYTAQTNVFGVNSITLSANTLSSSDNDPWYYATFENTNGAFGGYGFYIIQDGSSLSVNTGNYVEGYLNMRTFEYSGTSFSDYDNLVVATLRSRGKAAYVSDNGPVYEVSAITNVNMVCTGAYSSVSSNPYSTFKISGLTRTNQTFQFETSLLNSNTNYISKVFGVSNFDKPRTEVPLFVEESYSNLLNYAYNKGYIRGLNCNLIPLDSSRSSSSLSISNYLEQYQTPETPWVVSEVRGDTILDYSNL